MERLDHLARSSAAFTSASPPSLHWALTGPGHAVQFYENDQYLQEVVAQFLGDGLRCGQPVIAIATRSHCDLFREGLSDSGVDVKGLEASGELTLIDAHDVLDLIMSGSVPDPERFREVIGGIFDRAYGRRRLVRVYGELMDVLWKESNSAAALRLEQLWNALAVSYHFALLCSYCINHFMNGDNAAAFEAVCGQHHRVIPTERRATSPAVRGNGSST